MLEITHYNEILSNGNKYGVARSNTFIVEFLQQENNKGERMSSGHLEEGKKERSLVMIDIFLHMIRKKFTGALTLTYHLHTGQQQSRESKKDAGEQDKITIPFFGAAL